MHIHILGICGTFMGSLAILAKALGHRVTGSDANVYPPMSTQLEALGIDLVEGYDPAQLDPAPDLIIIGNAMSRGNPCVEAVLDKGLPYTSGPQWFSDYFLHDRWVLAVAGTHGKTTTSSMLAWILEYAGMSPGFLIGGIPGNFEHSARLGETPFFVVEADEYDSAFFDKRSKFVHYRPRTLVMNNLEFDHGDIFSDLADIQKQFHHLVRTVPANGRILVNARDQALQEVLQQGCWTPVENIGADSDTDSGCDWSFRLTSADGTRFEVSYRGQKAGEVIWTQTGLHNVYNGVMAIAAAHHVGVLAEQAVAALKQFKGVKRRLELLAEIKGVKIYDDFAHHPTAIRLTLEGLRQHVGSEPIIALIEPRSNTMRMGIHRQALAESTASADQVIWFQPPGLDWDLRQVIEDSQVPSEIYPSIDEIVARLSNIDADNAHLVIMSNGGFGGIHHKLVESLESRS